MSQGSGRTMKISVSFLFYFVKLKKMIKKNNNNKKNKSELSNNKSITFERANAL